MCDVLHLYSIIKAQQNLPNDMCALLGLMRVFAAEWEYRGRRDEGLEGTIIYGVVWWGSWVGLRWGSESGWEGLGCVCLWDSVRSVFDTVEVRVGLDGLQLTREWSWVG